MTNILNDMSYKHYKLFIKMGIISSKNTIDPQPIISNTTNNNFLFPAIVEPTIVNKSYFSLPTLPTLFTINYPILFNLPSLPTLFNFSSCNDEEEWTLIP